MSKARQAIKRLMVLESMWSLAKVVTDDHDGDTDQEVGLGLVWKLLLVILSGGASGTLLAGKDAEL